MAPSRPAVLAALLAAVGLALAGGPAGAVTVAAAEPGGAGPVAAAEPGGAGPVAAAAPGGVALAAPGPTPIAVPSPGNSDQPTPVAVVLDASGSMNQTDAPGPRIDAAKRAVADLVTALPADARVGLLAYGTRTGSRDEDKAASCKDILRLVPVGPLDRGAITGAVGGIRASGYTPIGAALQAAQRELPPSGPRAVVLVSDGEDTCAPPPPCQVAVQLKAAGIDLVVHTIGFKVDAAARAQLTCIASATGGTYREATSGAALGAELTRGVERAIRPYSAVGSPVRGTAAPAGAPLLRPGQYLDTYAAGGRDAGAEGTVKFYAVPLRPGDTPHISATIAPPPLRAQNVGALAVAITLVDAAGRGCGVSARDSLDIALFGKVSPQTSVLETPPVGGGSWSQSCSSGKPVYLRVARQGDAYRTQQLPVEIAYRAEPPVVETGPPAVPGRSAPLPAPAAAGTGTPTEAGYSYNDAPELAPGTYRGSITTGETRYLRVRLGWDQRLAYRLTFPPLAGAVAQSASLYVRLGSPLRSRAQQASGEDGTLLLGGPDPLELTGSSAAPVRYLNRESGVTAALAYTVDGGYYLVLDLSYRLGGGASLTFPYTLTVATSGGGPGPKYVTDPDTYGEAPSASATPSSAALPAGVAGGGPPAWALGGVAAGAVVVLAGALLWWRRSARRPSTGLHSR